MAKFESNSLNYLREKFSQNSKIEFQGSGGSNSHETDIKVIYNSKVIFSIESKFLPSQCGQFVVTNNDGQFEESLKNKSINKYSYEIVEQLNKIPFKYIKDSSLTELDVTQNVMFNWIKEHYSEKMSNILLFPTKY